MEEQKLIESIRLKLNLNWKTIKGIGAISLQNKVDNHMQTISFNTIKKVNGISLIGVANGYKSFPEIENILQKYYCKYRIKVGEGFYTIHTQSTMYDEIGDKVIRSIDDIDSIYELIHKIVYKEIIPFFDEHLTLKQVYEISERMEEGKRSTFLCNPVPIRRMLLKWNLQIDDFITFSEQTIDFYKKHSTGPYKTHFAPYLQFLPDLFEYLQETDPNNVNKS